MSNISKKIVIGVLGVILVVQSIFLITNNDDDTGYILSLQNPYVFVQDYAEIQFLIDSDAVVVLENENTNKRYIGFVDPYGYVSDWNRSLIEIDSSYSELYTSIEEVDVYGETKILKYYYVKSEVSEKYILIDKNESGVLKLELVDSTEGRELESSEYIQNGNQICSNDFPINFCAKLPNNKGLNVIDAEL